MRDAQAPSHSEEAAACPARPVRLGPLKNDLPTEKRALAEDLRQVFLSLGIGVRRYAARKHLDASTVTRYLSGRVPPWDFVAGLIADVQEAQTPLTPEAAAGLRELHRTALKSNRPNGEMQELQDLLAEADQEVRRITTRERALAETLLDREGQLAQVRGWCRNLETQMEEQLLTHRAEVELWRGEHVRLEEESGDLQEQVIYLQEALAVTRAELIAAEDRCHRLEARLDAFEELSAHATEDGGTPSIMAMLEEADRRSSVPELVQAVGDLEQRTRQAIASELVRSASQSRTVEEVAGLLSGLRQAGFDAHAQTALPAMVMVRSVDDTSALARELICAGLEDYVLILVQASVKFHEPEHAATFALALHHAGLTRYAESLLAAVAVIRPVADVVATAAILTGGELEGVIGTAMSAAAAQRTVADLVTLSIALRESCLDRYADALHMTAAAERSASDVAEFIRSLSQYGLVQDAETVFDSTQNRSIGHLFPLVLALREDRVWSVLSRVSAYRPSQDIAVLISELYMTGRHQLSTDLLLRTVASRSTEQIRDVVRTLDSLTPGSEPVLRVAVRTLTSEKVAQLLIRMERCGLPEQAETIFRCTVHDDLIGHIGQFLTALVLGRSHYGGKDVLCRYAKEMTVSALAPLMLALDSAPLGKHLDAVIESCCTDNPILDVMLLTKRLGAETPMILRADSVLRRLLKYMVRARSVVDLTALVGALQSAALDKYAELVISQALEVHGRPFRERLTTEQKRYEQKVMSRAFWSPLPAPQRRSRRM
ncbi:ATP/GTP-binding protein [Streptomyces sp. MBT65]|uniref:ATP/GTP-binding protein n=1 Tax=Streptomyces sp. MBT65 TaxID=1488395 RepID=UPI001909FE94|nr:ATP/GTP-binding protein [Streptomyces sp. MBT65]MBK3579860.1 ATP/GTP-binding protein [Streptomyces sp. MBT65]